MCCCNRISVSGQKFITATALDLGILSQGDGKFGVCGSIFIFEDAVSSEHEKFWIITWQQVERPRGQRELNLSF